MSQGVRRADRGEKSNSPRGIRRWCKASINVMDIEDDEVCTQSKEYRELAMADLQDVFSILTDNQVSTRSRRGSTLLRLSSPPLSLLSLLCLCLLLTQASNSPPPTLSAASVSIYHLLPPLLPLTLSLTYLRSLSPVSIPSSYSPPPFFSPSEWLANQYSRRLDTFTCADYCATPREPSPLMQTGR